MKSRILWLCAFTESLNVFEWLQYFKLYEIAIRGKTPSYYLHYTTEILSTASVSVTIPGIPPVISPSATHARKPLARIPDSAFSLDSF